jgi:hypothetical protein
VSGTALRKNDLREIRSRCRATHFKKNAAFPWQESGILLNVEPEGGAPFCSAVA